jgi:hypothetical protein
MYGVLCSCTVRVALMGHSFLTARWAEIAGAMVGQPQWYGVTGPLLRPGDRRVWEACLPAACASAPRQRPRLGSARGTSRGARPLSSSRGAGQVEEGGGQRPAMRYRLDYISAHLTTWSSNSNST